jgi:phytoene dehydrogenase-like protein
MAEVADHVIVGSGINALVAAALLSRKRGKVLVLERNDRIGGCIRTEEITEPGFVHDVMATTFVLFVTGPAMEALGDDLARHGVEFVNSGKPTGVLRPDGSHLILTTDRDANRNAFEGAAPGDGDALRAEIGHVEQNAEMLFGLLGGEAYGGATAKLFAKAALRGGTRNLLDTLGGTLLSSRAWLETRFTSELSRAVFAPWCLHAGLGPESAFAGEMSRIIAFALEAAGAPIVKGGAARLTDAFRAIIEENGGEIRTGADVSEILVTNGKATAVMLGSGDSIAARKSVIASVAPGQLYDRLLTAEAAGAKREDARRFRHGKANFQMHYALHGLPDWGDSALQDVALLHLTPGLDGVSRAVNEAERGLLPAVPTICVGQPHALDPSRCPDGKAILWLQMPEAPRVVKGDAAGKIETPADGAWTPALAEAYADRIEAILRSHIRNFDDIKGKRAVISPADLERMNINLVGGDPYGGQATIDQFFLWRPFTDTVNHKTHVKNLYHIGASTHPGPGLGGGSGVLLAGNL